MPVNSIYQKLSSLIKVSDLPQQLSFVEDGLETVFNDLYYKDLLFSKNVKGDTAFYQLTVVSYKRIGIDIPGTGFAVVLNPSHTNPNDETEIPVTLNYELPIKGFIKDLNFSEFSFQSKAIFDVLFEITQIAEERVILEVIDQFIDSSTPFDEFVDSINSTYSLTGTEAIPYPSGSSSDEKAFEITESIRTNSVLTVQQVDVIEATYIIYLNDSNDSIAIENVNRFLFSLIGDSAIEFIKRLFTPRISASLSIGVGIEFPRNILVPLDAPVEQGGEPLPEPSKSVLLFDVGDFSFTTEYGLGYDLNIIGNLSHPSQIGNTGLGINFSNAKLDLSRTTTIPEASLDGRPNDFVGVFIEEATITLPTFWNESGSNVVIRGNNIIAGTGGFTGNIGLELINPNDTNPPLLSANFGGGFEVSLDSFDITFQQNEITSSNINGTLKIPGFEDSNGNDAEININVNIGTDGEFSVTASEDQGISALHIEDVLNVSVDSLTVGRKADRFFVAVSGGIEFEDQNQNGNSAIGNFLPDSIDVQKLIIWQDGEIEFEGGALVLPSALTLKIPPVELSITAIGFGSHQQEHNGIERKYKFFEFSGGINVNPGGVDARGDGIKFYFTVDDDEVGQSKHVFVRIQGIGIDIMIPGNSDPKDAALILSGYLAMKDPAPGNEAAGTEYAGSIEFTLPRLKMGGSASMRLNPKVPAFVVDIGLEIATPIPLGATGLGIYGFRALVGQRYVATKNAAGVPDDGEWWQYYKAKISPDYKEGIQVSKFDQTNGFSLGAGVSLATSTDSGKTFSSKLFFLLSLPEVFMFQGQGQILKERIGLDSTNDPPFFALLAISKQSVETAFGINYKLPDDKRPGSIAKVDALIEMGFFFGNASGWYVNIGKDLPESRRVNVRLLELFDAYFYLMISASGMKAGAGAKFELDKKFGPLRAELGAYLDVAGQIAFKPKQYGASIQMGGKVGLYIFKFGFSISVDAGLAAEAPKPFVVTGSFKACVKVLRKDRCAKFQFSWIKDSTLDVGENQILDRPVAAKAINMLTRESFDLYNTGNALTSLSTSSIDNYVVPIDSFIDIEFLKGVLPSTDVKNDFGGNTQGAKYTDFVSPQKAKNSRVLHEYHLHNLKIYTWNGTSWVPYDIYDAATPLSLAPFVTTNLANLKKGYWQYQQPKLHNKLRVMAQSPLSFLSQGSGQPGDVLVEDLGITTESIYCPPEELVETCVNFNELGEASQTGEIMMEVNQGQVYHYDHFLFQVTGGNSNIIYLPYGNFANALHLNDNNQLNLVFNEPMSFVSLILQSEASSVEVQYYKNVPQPNLAPTNLPQFDYQLIESRTVSAAQLNNPVIYDDINESVDKVVVIGGSCENVDDPKELVCNDELTEQAKDLQNFLNVQLQNRQLTESFLLYPDENNIYNGVFQGSSLYPTLSNPDWFIDKRIDRLTENLLIFTVRDAEEISCQFSLQVVEGGINWEDIVGFTMIRPFNNQNGQTYEFEIDAVMSNGSKITLKGRSCYPVIECEILCNTYFYQVCFLTFEDAQYNETLPDNTNVQEEIDSMTAGFNESIQPIWRPNSYFAIELDTENRLFENNNNSPSIQSYSRKHIFAFKTKGPTGFFHLGNTRYTELENKDREAEFKLANLQHYIDYEKSYPNADGAIINAKPLFYVAPKLNLFYVRNYVYEFYRDWDEYQNNEKVEINLETIILDPAPDTSQPPMQPISVAWAANTLPGFVLDASTLNNMAVNGDPCVNTTPISPIGVNSSIEIDELEPLKLYTALFNARHKLFSESEFNEQEVHRYVFQTSRYADFEDQIKSYVLERDPIDISIIVKEAVFEIALTGISSTEINTSLEVITDTLSSSSTLRQEFADKYDRLIDGVLKIGAFHPAVTTEFNVIKSETTGNILGILIRNPEPFNDPKIPFTDMLGTVSGTAGSNSLDSKVFSKDNRSVFLTNATMNVTPGNYQFDFEYKQWAGDGYEPKTSVSVNIDLN